MRWFRALVLNVIALSLAALIGAVAYSQVSYVYEIPTGAIQIVTLLRGFVVSLVIAAVAPTTAFGVRLIVFIGIYLVDLALSVAASAAAVELVRVFFDGNGEAAKPWIYGGAIIPFITGTAAFLILRHYRSGPLHADEPQVF